MRRLMIVVANESRRGSVSCAGGVGLERRVARSLKLLALLAFALAGFAAIAGQALAVLPDGRVYEMVSPIKKDGNDAGGSTAGNAATYALSRDDGEQLLFSVGNAVGESNAGTQKYVTATCTPTGWQVRSSLPRSTPNVTVSSIPVSASIAPDLSRVAFGSRQWFSEEHPATEAEGGMYLTNLDGTADWISKPRSPDAVAGPQVMSDGADAFVPAGGSTDFSTFYFAYDGTLLPNETARAALLPSLSPPGIYAYKEKTLYPVGVLPDGTEDPYGAVFIGTTVTTGSGGYGDEQFENQVSADGTRAFFVSPGAGGSGRPPELYVRQNLERTVLISRSQVDGTSAPSGVGAWNDVGGSPGQSYAVASKDGHYVFFESADALTTDAPEGTSDYKAYRFDVDTERLQYLFAVPGGTANAPATGLAVTPDGSVLFETGDQTRLQIWTAAQGVQTIATMTGFDRVGAVRETMDSSVLAFTATLTTPGLSNPNGSLQVFRYGIPSAQLTCVSCPPAGADPAPGGASTGAATGLSNIAGATGPPNRELYGNHVISSDGRRVFFDTTDSLVPRDTNGLRDVYEWEEDGQVYLLSSGTSSSPSFLLDSSASGDDVFIATIDDLDPEDTDGQYDVYDARVGGGFPRVPVAPTCSDACQEASNAPLPNAPATVSFAGPGNLAPVSFAGIDRAVSRPSLSIAKVKAVKGTSVTVRVKVAGAGAITVSGGSVRRVSEAARGVGVYSLRVSLTAKGRSMLSKRGVLATSVTVLFKAKSGGSSSRRVTLAFKQSAKGLVASNGGRS
jgi:hypothetical protein